MAEVLPEVLEAAGGEEALGVVGRLSGELLVLCFHLLEKPQKVKPQKLYHNH